MGVGIPTGTTIAFGTSSFTAQLRDITLPTHTREAVNTSHMGTTTAHTFTPVDLYDGSELTVDIIFDPDDSPPISAAAEVVTITFPLQGAESTNTTWVFTGFMTEYAATAPFEDLMTGSFTVKVSGSIAITPAT